MYKQNIAIKSEVAAWSRRYQLLDSREEGAVFGMAIEMVRRVFPKKIDKLFVINFLKAWITIYVLDYFYDTLGVKHIKVAKNHGFGFFLPRNIKISLRDKKRTQGLSAAIQSIVTHYSKKQRKHVLALIEKMLNAMEYENNIQYMRRSPLFSEYLEKTKESIGSKLLFAMVYYHYSIKRIKKFQKIENSCARVARLTNELVSFSKERQEKKKNAIDLLITKGMSEREAKKYIKKRIKYEQKNIIKILKEFRDPFILKSFITNFVKWLLNIYGKSSNSGFY